MQYNEGGSFSRDTVLGALAQILNTCHLARRFWKPYHEFHRTHGSTAAPQHGYRSQLQIGCDNLCPTALALKRVIRCECGQTGTRQIDKYTDNACVFTCAHPSLETWHSRTPNKASRRVVDRRKGCCRVIFFSSMGTRVTISVDFEFYEMLVVSLSGTMASSFYFDLTPHWSSGGGAGLSGLTLNTLTIQTVVISSETWENGQRYL